MAVTEQESQLQMSILLLHHTGNKITPIAQTLVGYMENQLY